MPGNVEIKAKIGSIEATIHKALSISDEHIPLDQTDTFFKSVNECRLKLRTEKHRDTGVVTSTLIGYQRPDRIGPKFSQYFLTTIPDPESLTSILEMSNGVLGKVEKLRDAFIVYRNNLRARVHIDNVKGLGSYIEFEIIVEDEDQFLVAQEFAEYLSNYFGVTEKDLIAGAYWNLLQALPAQADNGASTSSAATAD